MLNFTYTDGKIAGQFNGRFVFRASPDATPLAASTFADLSLGSAAAWTDATLRHEYFHWRAFRHSRIGMEIVGRRFRARQAFARGRLEPVIDYYGARTCYFVAAYDAHERVVDEISNRMEAAPGREVTSAALTRAQSKALGAADRRAIHLMRACGVRPRLMALALDRALGAIATREYALQSWAPDSKGQVRILETAMFSPTRGVISAVYEVEPKRPSRLRQLVRPLRAALNTERRGGGITKERLAQWGVLKFRTEYRTTLCLYDIDRAYFEARGGSPDAFFRRYCESMVDFALRHTLLRRDRLYARSVANLLFACAKSTDSQLAQQAEDLVKLEEPILYFFFIHAN